MEEMLEFLNRICSQWISLYENQGYLPVISNKVESVNNNLICILSSSALLKKVPVIDFPVLSRDH
jgi:hypothetical protein